MNLDTLEISLEISRARDACKTIGVRIGERFVIRGEGEKLIPALNCGLLFHPFAD